MKTTWLAIVLAGCTLTSKSAPIEYRYFSPEARAAPAVPPGTCSRLRLGRIGASDHLRYRIAHRRSAVELELDDTLRWTERPEDYVRRALVRSLDERGIPRAIGDAAPVLDLEVTAFEEVERGGRHFGRVELRYELAGDRDVVEARTIAVEREAASADVTRVVTSIGEALQAATAELGDRLAARLCR